MAANTASRRPVRLSIRILPPEVVGTAKWWQRIYREVRGRNTQAHPSEHETWRRKAWCIRRGFMPTSYDLYELGAHDRRDYLNDRQREMTWILNWPYAAIMDDKLGFDYMLRQLGAPTPDTRALIVKGKLTPLDGPRGVDVEAWWQERLERLRRLVLKPIWGAKGGGIAIVEHAVSGCTVNGVPTTLAELGRRVSELDRYLVSDFAQQAAYAEEIFPGTANSMRIVTMHDEDHEPFIAFAAHRFGAQRSKRPVDNWSAGGLSARIDLATGELSAGVTSLEYSRMERHDRHPDTGTPIKGNRVTNWDVVKAGILDISSKLPFLPYIGWDVIATDSDAGFLILEGNKQTHVNFIQVHGPLLTDPRIRGFYEREGILEPAA